MHDNPLLSSRALNTPPSPIRSLSKYARVAINDGKVVHGLNIGQPDLPTPPEFLSAIKDYQVEVLAYEDSAGNLGLRETWANYYNQNQGINLDAENFLITTGASEALIFAFMVCCDPGAEVIVFEPTYANYMGFAAISGVNLVPVSTELESGFVLPEFSEIEQKLTANTRAILLCNPNNPTGTVYNKEEVQALLTICEEHNLFLIVDETYREIIFDDKKLDSVLSVAPNSKNLIVVDSLSKRYSLCGARIGCLVSANQEFLEKTHSLAQARLASPTLEQMAASAMLKSIDPNYVANVCKEYQLRRDTLAEGLRTILDLEFTIPSAAFYCIARLPVSDSTEFVKFMLTDFDLNGETVFLAPAKGFYISPNRGSSKVRLAAVLNSEKLSRSVEILAAGLTAFKSKS